MTIRTMPKSAIKPYVLDFLKYAEMNPSLKFQVTQIGCGLAGYNPVDIAPMFWTDDFRIELPNVYYDLAWKDYLDINAKFWGTM